MPPRPAPELPDPDFWGERAPPRSVAPAATNSQGAAAGDPVTGAQARGGPRPPGSAAPRRRGSWPRHAAGRAPRQWAPPVHSTSSASPTRAPTSSAVGDNRRPRGPLVPARRRCADRGGVRQCRPVLDRPGECRLPARSRRHTAAAYLTAVLPGFAGGPALAAGSEHPPAQGAEDERAWSRRGAPPRRGALRLPDRAGAGRDVVDGRRPGAARARHRS